MFNSKETEELALKTKKLDATLSQLGEIQKTLADEIKENKKNIERINILTAALREAKPAAPISPSLVRSMQAIGLLLVLVSLVFSYTIASEKSFSSNPTIIWAIYISSQLAGLYLLGYGKEFNFQALQRFGGYLSFIFLLACAAMTLSIVGLIDFRISQGLIYLATLNSIGILILIYAERKAIRIHHLKA